MNDVTVVGAGISGLTAAWCLADAGARVRVVDAAPQPGGLLRTIDTPYGPVETAAGAFTQTARTDALFRAAGVAPIAADARSRRRYIYRDGRPTRWPLTGLETAGAAARLSAAWVTRRTRPRPDECVRAWADRALGRPAAEWLVGPAFQGIYASPLEALSARAVFSAPNRRGGTLVAPRHGMRELVDGLHRVLAARGVEFAFDTTLPSLDPRMPAVICTGAPAAARLLAWRAPIVSGAIGRIRMTSLVTVTAFFEPNARDLHGFGILFPRESGIKALGAILNSDVFPGRTGVRSETWIYGEGPGGSVPDHGAALAAMLEDRRQLTGRNDAPLDAHVTPQPAAIPVYDAAVAAAIDALRAHPLPETLAIAGNYLGRLGISKLVDGAFQAAAAIMRPSARPIYA
jgi:oxygen-dependent protoporphyrinogen oxidase